MDELGFEDMDRYLLEQNGRIIHQIWFGIIPNKRAARKAFEGLRKYRDSWLVNNSTWTYVCWDLSKSYKLIYTYYNEHLELYNSYPYAIQRCDAVRYFILHRYGGIYADMDYFCVQPFDKVFSIYHNHIYFVETPNKLGDTTHVSNSLMYSKPGHVFWKKLFIELEMHKTAPYYYGRHMTIMFTTGPGVLNRVYNKYKIRYTLDYFPYKLFHPFGLSSTDIIHSTTQDRKDVYAIHIGKGSWEENDSRILIFLFLNHKLILFLILVIVVPQLAIYIKNKLFTPVNNTVHIVPVLQADVNNDKLHASEFNLDSEHIE